MGAKGITIAEEGHIVNMLPPIDVTAGAQTSLYVNLENYAHASIIVTMGIVTNDTLIKMYESKDNGGAVKEFIGFDYYIETTAAGDTLATRATVASTGFQTGTNNATTFAIEIDASELTADYKYLAILTDAPGNALISVLGVLSGSRYASDPSKRQSAIT